ncbi:MAG: hypothetical protein Homavirus4_11 [Homavirus sp.]|uniref:Uncharacterized protein n=1 Tax=Homavirus sp. TaxID=2487769 RepID=A0A3G5A4A5_9VIRU|nr:MAG: hypothetical protein Homavirus4_11 [Homavirus sp.]
MDYGYNEQPKTCGVYNIKGVKNESKAIIVPNGMIELKGSEYVMDKRIETFNIVDNVVGEIYLCNIVDSFLMSTKKLPVMYVSIFIDMPMRRIYLFKQYLYFTITSNITKSEELIENKLDGVYTIEVAIDDKHIELNKKIEKFPGIKQLISMFIEFIKSVDSVEFIKGLVKSENNRLLKEFSFNHSDCEIPKATISLANYNLDD